MATRLPRPHHPHTPPAPRPSRAPAAAAQIGVKFGLTPDGAPRVILMAGQANLELDPTGARNLAGAMIAMAGEAEACAMLRDTAQRRWGVLLPIPEVLDAALRYHARQQGGGVDEAQLDASGLLGPRGELVTSA